MKTQAALSVWANFVITAKKAFAFTVKALMPIARHK
jgi:hypothetical protein